MEAKISLRIQMDSVCTCGVLEMTMKLVNPIIFVTAHMVIATNMRMIICFMLSLTSCDLQKGSKGSPDLLHTNVAFLQNRTHLPAYLFQEYSSELTRGVDGPGHDVSRSKSTLFGNRGPRP
jgi:hypothetical protein